LLDSAIALIAETGAAATSTQAVLDHSGVSRGSLLHHYPTRRDLMVAVAAEAIRRRVEAVEERLSGESEPIEALRRYPEVQWQVESEAPARALVEILLAARWDKALEEGLRPTVVAWNRRLRNRIHAVARVAGLSNADELAAEVSVLVAATRGLSATSSLLGDEQTVPRTLAALSARYRECLSRGLQRDGTPSSLDRRGEVGSEPVGSD
jgi:AcrR family transcriptional regulator